MEGDVSSSTPKGKKNFIQSDSDSDRPLSMFCEDTGTSSDDDYLATPTSFSPVKNNEATPIKSKKGEFIEISGDEDLEKAMMLACDKVEPDSTSM